METLSLDAMQLSQSCYDGLHTPGFLCHPFIKTAVIIMSLCSVDYSASSHCKQNGGNWMQFVKINVTFRRNNK